MHAEHPAALGDGRVILDKSSPLLRITCEILTILSLFFVIGLWTIN